MSAAPIMYYYTSGIHDFHAYFDHDPRLDPSGALLPTSSGGIQRAIPGLQGQYYDELTVGYERRLAQRLTIDARFVRRTLRQGLEDASDSAGHFWLANPGTAPLQDYPRIRREYTALEVSARGAIGPRLSIVGSYVLSRNYGNYEGLYDSWFHSNNPNAGPYFDYTDVVVNGTGLLPNDRTHVLKLATTYWWGHGLTLGSLGLFESGTPISEMGGTAHPNYPGFIGARGSHGRTPTVWDLSFRIGYELARQGWVRPRV